MESIGLSLEHLGDGKQANHLKWQPSSLSAVQRVPALDNFAESAKNLSLEQLQGSVILVLMASKQMCQQLPCLQVIPDVSGWHYIGKDELHGQSSRVWEYAKRSFFFTSPNRNTRSKSQS